MSSKRSKNRKSNRKQKKSVEDNSIRCITCGVTLVKKKYARCLKCPEFVQCLSCLSVGRHDENHEISHPYLILDDGGPIIYQEDWNREEEALLLIGLNLYGIGNWEEICKLQETKTAIECEEHYLETYIQSSVAPSPQRKILPPILIPPPPSYDTTPHDSRPSISNEYNLHLHGKKMSTTPGELAGFMPLREEFDTEYINEAEDIISEMVFSPNETVETFQNKMKQLKAYNNHIIERKRRRNFVQEWGLIDKEVKDFGGETPEEKEMEKQMMPLAQVAPKNDILDLVHALEDQMRLKADLTKLITWRKNGIATHDEGFLFDRLNELLSQKSITEQEVEEWNSDITR